MPQSSREKIARLRKRVADLRSTNNRDRKMYYAKGYKKAEADLGKVPKPPKIKKVRVTKTVVREVPATIKARQLPFADLVANLISAKAFCGSIGMQVPTFVVFLAICTFEKATTSQLKLFNLSPISIAKITDTLEKAGLVEVFKDTRPMTITTSLKGQKLFSSFKEYYGKNGADGQRKSDRGVKQDI